MKKNRILIIIICLILIGLVAVTIYKFNNKKEEKNTSFKNSELIITKLTRKKTDIEYSDVLDKETYSDNIIYEYLERTYTFYDAKKTIEGRVYLDENKNLHITNENNYEDVKVSNIKFKSLYGDNSEYENGMYIHLISEDNKLYYFGLLSSNLKDFELKEIPTKYKVLNFVDISFDNDINPDMYKLFVLADDGNIYEVFSGLRYSKDIKSIFNYVLVFKDKTMTNQIGNIFEDKDGNPYKIKYIFSVKSNEEYIPYDSIMIITEDNKLIATLYEDNFAYIYEETLKIKDISFDKYNPFIYGNLKINFGDEVVNFEAMCSSYYCVNEFNTTETEEIQEDIE